MKKFKHNLDNRTSQSTNLMGVVWLIGIAILAITDWWWPGILILVGASLLIKSIGKRTNEAELPPPEIMDNPAPEARRGETIIPPPSPSISTDWVPGNCKKCGAPLTTKTVQVIDRATVQCPFCGTIIKNEN